MIHQIGGLVLLAIAVIVFGRLLGGEVARTWDARWPRTRPSRRQAVQWATTRARSAGRSAFSYGHARWTRSRLAGRLPARLLGVRLRKPEQPAEGGGEGDERRPPGTPDPGDASQQPAPHRRNPRVVQGSVVDDGDEKPAGDEAPAQGDDGTAPPAPGDPESPARPQTTGRNPGMTTPATASASPALVPGAEEMTTGMARLRAYAVNGNILAKQAALAALAEVLAQNAATVAALARSMQEESMYGPEITEPVAGMAPALSALSTRAAEAESQVASLARTPVGEVPGSRHQAPDRREMQEAGGR